MVRLRHEKQFRLFFFSVKPRNIDNKHTMNRIESSHQVTATTSSKSANDFNVIESLKEYNRSQINKIACIEGDTTAVDHDVSGATHDTDIPQLLEPAAITKTVVLVDCDLLFFASVILSVFCLYFFLPVEKISNLL